jgi:hypothetical protein
VPSIALFRLLKEIRAENQEKVDYVGYLKNHLDEEDFKRVLARIEAIRKRTIKLAKILSCSSETICIFVL